ncbi:mucin-like protein [Lineus longissimus]|uniref:mucin-like protein n=1 Tax=Lineus longissimus TaxID=88925 RepID=UPI00315DF37C
MPYADADYSVTGDDSLSYGVYLPGGMPFGSENVQRLFVSTNGYVVFDHRYYSISPSTSSFPAPYGKPLIAPYWTDLDARYTNVKFDVYHDRTSKRNQNYIMAALGNYVKNFNSSYSSFSPNLAVVVTWPEVPPYPAFTYRGIESATIQLSLVTDGTDSFAIFNYYNMTLTPTTFWRRVGIGYTSSSRYGASFYEKNALSFTTDSYIIDTIAGNTGVAGKWIYKINSASSGSFTPARMCFSWHSQQTALIARNTCPNTHWQAMVDFRYRYMHYMYYNGYNMDPRVYCFIQRFMRYDWASGQWIREMCCYDMIYGSLETKSPNAGSAISSLTNDLTGKSLCCFQSNFCHLYYEMRPISYSTSYRRMFFTWMWGDPHIKTLDGASYTYNGHGEYLMMQTTDTTTMIVQARMEVAESGVNATIFTSFVVQSNQSDIVQVNLNQARDAMLIYVNGGANNYTIADLANETEHLGVSLSNAANGSLQITFETGFGIKLKIGYKALEAAVQAPNGYEGLIEGLLGNYDSDSTNDYVFRNGTMISSNSSERELYAFGKTWQLTNELDSKFTYFGNESFVGFHNKPAFTPVFADEYKDNLLSLFNNDTSLLAAANSTCYGISSYMSCMYDAASLGTINAAKSAVSHTEDADNQENTMSNNPPTFSTMNSTLTLYLNSTSNLTLNATDPEGGKVTFKLSGNSTDVATIDDVSDTLSITPGGNPFFITVLAADSAGSSSAWQPNVYVCDCLNGGACDFSYVDEPYSESNSANYYGAECTCINGYVGDKCETSPCDAEPLPCYEGVVCSLVDGAVTCGACPTGLKGDGNKCYDVNECIETPNICEDVCTNVMFSYSCSCTKAGFEVSTANSSLCVDVDECAYGLDDCNATLGEICVNTAGNYSCECKRGYGKDADNYCIDIDECTVGSHDCDANANCTNNAGSWSCSCNSGYYGNGTSCSDTDECANSALNDCQMFCNNTLGSFNCSCTSGYELNNDGKSCIVAAGSECSGGNTCNQLCAIQNGVDTCSCYSGYELDSMDNTTCIDINECNLVVNPCTHICTNKIDGYKCSCNSSGYSLANDGYTCENIDECTLGTSNCAANTSTCTDNDGSYSCACNSGYSGDGTSCTDIDECRTSDCLANANCFNYPGSYKCQCKLGYYGNPYTACNLATHAYTGKFSLTATFDSALSDTTTTAYHTLAQTIEDRLFSHFLTYFAVTFKNVTMVGFSAGSTVASFSLTFGAGTSISSPTLSSVRTTLGTLTSNSGGRCFIPGIGASVCSSVSSADFDECSNKAHNCTASNTKCSNTVGSYDCVCVSGYTSTGTDANGNPICGDVNECLSTCTLAHSECTNSIGSYTCSCASGYVSKDPENVACLYDACDSTPCQNGGACQSDSSQSSGYTCICPSGYSGDNCETYEKVASNTIVAIVVGSVLGIIAFILITILVILRATGKLSCLRPKKTIEPIGLVNEDPVVSMSKQNRGFTIDSYTSESDTPVTQRDVSRHGYPSEKAMYVEDMIRQHPVPMVPSTAAATVADGHHPMQVDERPNTGRAASAGKQGSIAAGMVVATGNVGRGSASTQGRPSSSNRRTSNASGKVEQHSPDVASTPVGTKTESALGQGGSGSLLPTENEPNFFDVRGNAEVRIPSANANAAQSTRPGSGTYM